MDGLGRQTYMAQALTSTNARFYMVVGRGTPTHRHPTYEAAEKEARRLARQDPEQEFVVLGAMSRVKKSDVTVERLHHDDDELPF